MFSPERFRNYIRLSKMVSSKAASDHQHIWPDLQSAEPATGMLRCRCKIGFEASAVADLAHHSTRQVHSSYELVN